MKNNITELVFILDRSGSMAGLESDTIGGFNSMIEKQKKQDGGCYVSTVLFDDEIEVLHDRVKLGDIPKMTDNDYTVSGCTALIDAIGGAIHHIGNIHKYTRPEDLPEHTMFVITTDGQENASHKYTSEQVKKMIERQKENTVGSFFLLALTSMRLKQRHVMALIKTEQLITTQTVRVLIFFMSRLRKQFAISEQAHRLAQIGAKTLTQTTCAEEKRISN